MISAWNWRVLVAVALVAAAGSAFALRDSHQEKTPVIADFAWLAGGWRMQHGDVVTEEHWIPPAGGTLLGVSRTVKGDTTKFFEFLRLEQRKDAIVYVAHPGGRSPGTDFKLTSWNGVEAVFENPTHDFPTLIRYAKQDDGSLVARIEGQQNGQPASEEFRYQRIGK